ncbi:putative BOI-related E3 ubiquitin-protein ligase 2 [Hibiscus syriacus]|uniref:BOI-related E3 ubiquitin-protein ligase 2 n=1 Tax=Hibiscus syriacus TaxID=106335 RepID=A0A6A3BEM2_HIBSY|nr:E3 ubiquitin-protein ligase BOI-like isoform X2 [Hibiscus syriacus]KAE8715063.1 putative BOI-related E3 ubiquitin-protein ligase 2 [Hibiscus syriacus]
MAVEARRMDILPPRLIANRDFIKTNQGMGNLYNTQMDSCVPLVDSMQPLYQSLVCDPNISAKTSINKADSGLTFNMNIPVSSPRKRSRDSFNNGFDSYSIPQKNKLSDVFSQIQQQQQDIDCFISDHTEKVRMELEERRKSQSRMLITAIQEGVMKKLREKDEEIQRIGKLNWVLQERVKSLYVENQLWRDLAQTNEATANSLRSNLEQVLAHMGGAALEDDAESSCGSCDNGWRKVVVMAAEDKAVVVGNGDHKCRKCGEKESSVLLLPCRHLCLCTMCGSTIAGTCPVCLSVANASLHVNMS